MEISKGMYVRTHQGIARIVEKPNISVVVWNDRKVIYVDKNGHPVPTSFNFFVFEDEITASSFNIIDLIEVGDYVNGERVYYAYCSSEGSTGLFIEEAGIRVWLEKDSQIKDIVTNEQFNSMKYVVEKK